MEPRERGDQNRIEPSATDSVARSPGSGHTHEWMVRNDARNRQYLKFDGTTALMTGVHFDDFHRLCDRHSDHVLRFCYWVSY